MRSADTMNPPPLQSFVAGTSQKAHPCLPATGINCSFLPVLASQRHWELQDGPANIFFNLQPCCYSSWSCRIQALLLAFMDELQVTPPLALSEASQLSTSHVWHTGRAKLQGAGTVCVWLGLHSPHYGDHQRVACSQAPMEPFACILKEQQLLPSKVSSAAGAPSCHSMDFHDSQVSFSKLLSDG